MAVKIDKGHGSTIDFTPMIDMVFNLLIFFMVATNFAKEDRELNTPLATASAAQSLTATPDTLFINIDVNGNFIVDRKLMATDEVAAYLRQQLADKPNLSVKIRPDVRGTVQATVEALDLAAQAGVRDASIVTEGRPD